MTPRLVSAICSLGLILVFQGCASTPEPEPAKRQAHQQEIVVLQHANSAEVVAALGDLGRSGEPEPGPKMVAIAHQATNSVLLSGPQKQIERARDLIARLDKPIK